MDDYTSGLDLARVHQQRGEFISAMNTVEGLIDSTICAHFGVDVTNAQFRGWLLSRINMIGKIEVAGSDPH